MQVKRSVAFPGMWMVVSGVVVVTDNHDTPSEAIIQALALAMAA